MATEHGICTHSESQWKYGIRKSKISLAFPPRAPGETRFELWISAPGFESILGPRLAPRLITTASAVHLLKSHVFSAVVPCGSEALLDPTVASVLVHTWAPGSCFLFLSLCARSHLSDPGARGSRAFKRRRGRRTFCVLHGSENRAPRGRSGAGALYRLLRLWKRLFPDPRLENHPGPGCTHPTRAWSRHSSLRPCRSRTTRCSGTPRRACCR